MGLSGIGFFYSLVRFLCNPKTKGNGAENDIKTVKGPASYFPSIEQKYGKPIAYWLSLVGKIKDKKHMEIVALLKAP